MRLFAAIPVEADALASLVRLVRHGRSTDWPVKWVREEGLHITLKFLGEVEPARTDTIGAAVAEATHGTGTLPFTARELGAFPDARRARVLWAGFDSEPALELLVDRLERGLARLGFEVEGRAFRPHATLGRVRNDARLPAEAAEWLERMTPEGSFTAGRVVLFRSEPGPGGSRYTEVAAFPLDR